MAQREGEIEIYHPWGSPGLPEDLARKMGVKPGSGTHRVSTLTCHHCRATVVKNPFRIRERYSCWQCGGAYVCDICAAKMREPDYVHTPFERMVDEALKGG